MKSPAYNAGRWNLKGKKSFLCPCRCCVVLNFKDKYFEYLANKELKEELLNLDL